MSDLIKAFSLQLFAEGSSEGTGATADAADSQNEGVNAPAPEVQTEADLDAEFKDLIKGKYSKQFHNWAEETVKNRLKGTKDVVDKYNKLAPTLATLSTKYGVDASDIDALNKAIEEDDSYLEDEAMERNMSVQQLREVRKIERENANLKAQMREADERKQAEQDVAKWMEEAQDAARTFPNLDLGVELQNPEFVRLLKSNISVENAYFAIHHKELVPQAMQFAAKEAEKNVANTVMANKARPTENGTQSQSSAVVKNDVASLTAKERADFIRRASQGERISFNK